VSCFFERFIRIRYGQGLSKILTTSYPITKTLMLLTSMPGPGVPAASALLTPSARARIPASSRSSMFFVSPSKTHASYPPSPSSPCCIAASNNNAASVRDPFCSSSALASLSGERVAVDGPRYLLSSSDGHMFDTIAVGTGIGRNNHTENIFPQDR